jgi:hypothetical protein
MGPDARAATPGELRRFALLVGGAFLALAAAGLWRGAAARAAAFALLGAPLALAGLIAPARLGPVYRAWMALAVAMSRVTTPVFMGLIYFCLLTPLGVAMRLFGRRAIGVPPGAPTAWVDRPPGERRGDMRRQF